MTDTPELPPKALPLGAYPPGRVEIAEFHLRRYTRDDALGLHAAIAASFAELHPWMPWCVEPVRIEDQRDFIERSFLSWATGRAFDYGVFDADGTQIGAVSLMDRLGPGGLEIGYWLRTDVTGRGIMTRAAERLTGIGLDLPEIDRIEIHCDEANLRSAAVPKRLGFRLDRIDDDEVKAAAETGRSMVWVTP